MRVGAGFNTGDHVKSYAAQFAGGGAQGPFAATSLSTVQYDDITGSGTAFDVSGGYSVDITPAGTAQFCPRVGFAYQTGPNVSTGFGTVTTSTHVFALGGSFGGIAATSPGFEFVPFASASYVIAQGSASLAGQTSSQNQNYTELGVGAGFVFNRTLTIQAVANIPVGHNYLACGIIVRAVRLGHKDS
jgi:hypothetical protein